MSRPAERLTREKQFWVWVPIGSISTTTNMDPMHAGNIVINEPTTYVRMRLPEIGEYHLRLFARPSRLAATSALSSLPSGPLSDSSAARRITNFEAVCRLRLVTHSLAPDSAAMQKLTYKNYLSYIRYFLNR